MILKDHCFENFKNIKNIKIKKFIISWANLMELSKMRSDAIYDNAEKCLSQAEGFNDLTITDFSTALHFLLDNWMYSHELSAWYERKYLKNKVVEKNRLIIPEHLQNSELVKAANQEKTA